MDFYFNRVDIGAGSNFAGQTYVNDKSGTIKKSSFRTLKLDMTTSRNRCWREIRSTKCRCGCKLHSGTIAAAELYRWEMYSENNKFFEICGWISSAECGQSVYWQKYPSDI